MNRCFAFGLLLALCAMCLIRVPAFGQQPSTGLPSLGSFAGGPFDTINLANLDVHFAIPIFGRAGKGIPLSYSMSYDSLIWSPVSQQGASVWTPVTNNWGWRTVTEAATGYVSYSDFNFVDSCPTGEFSYGETTSYWTGLQYHDPTGGIHSLGGAQIRTVTISSSSCGTIGTTIYPVQNAAAVDNSGYIVNTSATSALGPATVNARGGLKIITPNVGSMTGAGSVTDANGNQVSISSAGVITDTLGTALTVTGTPSSGPVSYAYTAPSGASASVKFYYSQKTVQTCFQVSGIYEFAATAEYLPYEVLLPDGSAYHFTYEATASAGSCTAQTGAITGRIASIQLPTGGTISYSYAGTGCGNNSNCMMADGSPSAIQRTFQTLGTWDYTRAIQSGQQLPQTTTSITDPAGNLTALLFSGMYETDRKVYTGSSSLLDHSYICYVNGESHSLCSTASVTTQPITFRGVIDFPNDNGSYYSELDTFYDGTYGFVTLSKAWDFGNGSSHNLLQQPIITYNSSLCSSKNICDHPASVQVLDGGGTQKALTNYFYDGNGNTTEVDWSARRFLYQ